MTKDVVAGRVEVRVWTGEDVALFGSAPHWMHHYRQIGEGVCGCSPTGRRRRVRRAVAAVVYRDMATVGTMLVDPDSPAADFWTWVDTHWPADTPMEPWSPARLPMPPPAPIEDWEGEVARGEETGGCLVRVDFLDADDPERETDLSRELSLSYDATVACGSWPIVRMSCDAGRPTIRASSRYRQLERRRP